jgi:DNA-binding CsgD family transcriptional regulator
MPEGQLLALTEQIYDAGVGGTPWFDVCSSLKALVGARSAALMVGELGTGPQDILYHAEIPLDAAAAYRQHYRRVDLWTNRASRLIALHGAEARARILTSGEMLVPDHEFLRSEFYCDFGRRLGLRYVVGTVAPLGAAGVMPIGLHRPEGATPFGEGERRLLEQVLPHLRRALQLRHRLKASEAAAGLAALDGMPTAALVVDAEMRVLVANLAAEALAAKGAGLALQREVGLGRGAAVVARARRHADGAVLASLVRATALGGSAGGAVRLQDTADATAVVALVAPLPKRLSDKPAGGVGRVAGRALILLRDLAAAPPLPTVGLLREVFGLTRAEAEVARGLAGGNTKKAVAAGRGSRESTVRTHVRAVLEKTGAANLRELERLLAGLHGH